MKIRFARSSDQKQILKLLEELIDNATKKGVSAPKHIGTREEKEAILKEAMKRNDIYFFVVEDNKKLLGLAEIFIVPIVRRGYYQGVVESLIVTEGMRGKGIGSMLFDRVKEFCKQKNIRVIKLTSGVQLTNSHRFYERHGGKFTEKLFKFDLT